MYQGLSRTVHHSGYAKLSPFSAASLPPRTEMAALGQRTLARGGCYTLYIQYIIYCVKDLFYNFIDSLCDLIIQENTVY